MSTRTVLWDAQQICGQCGEGAFLASLDYGPGPVCSVCEHVHPMEPWNLGAGEEYVIDPGDGTLHVVAYDEPEVTQA